MTHPGRLEGKVAIVTGGSTGLGAGTVQKFLHEGAQVVIFDLVPPKVTNPTPTLQYVPGSVANEADWARALSSTVSAFGKLDIVVNNAGVVHRAQASGTVPKEEYDRIMDVNVSPLWNSAKIVHPYFAKQGKGVFVNISSVSATRPRPNLVWYAGSKGAVSAVTKGLAAEWAKDGIRCNAILPVAADTGMMANVLGGTDTPEGRAVVLKGVPMGRLATPEDIGNAACFLASDEAALITGIELPVDGGRSLM